MGTTDKTQIRALIEAVEVGDMDGYDFDVFSDPKQYAAFIRAYHGSLDAALALHDALLPGWGLVVNCGKDYASVRADKDMHLSDESFFHAESISPARAALLAILRAYEAQQ